ncbi:MAG: flagellar hook-basal body complex protein FliE [Frankiales bacterium]|nr:flagellar hook-basal body complex protein FliE [Frankiales bacterium]
MSISPLGFTPGLTGLGSMPAIKATPTPTQGTAPAGGADFGAAMAGSLGKLQALNNNTDQLAVQAATGDLKDVHNYMIASTESSLATEMTVAVRNKAVEAFTEIMRMQV